MDTAFSLLEVDWIRGEIPVHHSMAIPVKVEPLLSDIKWYPSQTARRTG